MHGGQCLREITCQLAATLRTWGHCSVPYPYIFICLLLDFWIETLQLRQGQNHPHPHSQGFGRVRESCRTITLIIGDSLGPEINKKTKPHKNVSVHVPWEKEQVCDPSRNITWDSPLVRIFRWFVIRFDFLLIEWMLSLDNLSLSDSSSSFFLYFRTEREECGNVYEQALQCCQDQFLYSITILTWPLALVADATGSALLMAHTPWSHWPADTAFQRHELLKVQDSFSSSIQEIPDGREKCSTCLLRLNCTYFLRCLQWGIKIQLIMKRQLYPVLWQLMKR